LFEKAAEIREQGAEATDASKKEKNLAELITIVVSDYTD